MTKKVSISARPINTCVGGTDWVPKALRVSDSTIANRVNEVASNKIEGAIEPIVSNKMMTTVCVRPVLWVSIVMATSGSVGSVGWVG